MGHKRLEKHDFVSALRVGTKMKAQTMQMFFRRNACGSARLGIVVSKKVAPRAVDRNRTKRILRELFRGLQAKIAAYDIIIRVQGTYDVTFEAKLKKDAQDGLLRIS